MSHNYLQRFYHFAWATRNREGLIRPELEPALDGYMRRRCEEPVSLAGSPASTRVEERR